VHDHPTPDDDGYEWPTCVACGKDLWTDELDRLACRPCGDRTLTRIRELPGLFTKLNTTAALMKGARRVTSGGSGSRTAPIPVRLDVLDMAGPGGVAAKLQAIEDSWRQALGWAPVIHSDDYRVFALWRTDPARMVPAHARFLGDNLLWACGSYESIAEDMETIRHLHSGCTALVLDERKPGRVQIGNCPVRFDDDGLCAAPLTASAASHRVRCGNCNTAWETLGEWRELRTAQEAVAAEGAERQQQEGGAA